MPKGLLFSVDTFTPTSRSTVAEIKSSGFRFKPKAVNFHDKPCQINNGKIDFQGNSVELSTEEFHDDFDAESILDEEIEQEEEYEALRHVDEGIEIGGASPVQLMFFNLFNSTLLRKTREKDDKAKKME
ncbi:hypothetical protein Q3G72_031322 [Acer saccharum]|nr:hypothetical protein Q3G72_031322 [Acer saccharum]